MRVLPPWMRIGIGANTGAYRNMLANLLKNWSSTPKTTEGRMMVAPGNASRTRASPSAFERA